MRLNTDVKIVEAILNRLGITGGFCPCIPQSEWNLDTKCPCKKMTEENECHCGLYVNDEEV